MEPPHDQVYRRVAPPPPPRADRLHIFSDGSILRKMAARDLAKISIWNGNRSINDEHKNEIAAHLGPKGIQSLDLKPFHVVTYEVEDENGSKEIKTVIVDGQHRVTIIKEQFMINPTADSFDVLVVEKRCESESEVIRYFKILNTTKSIAWKADPTLLANSFVQAFEKTFGKKAVRPNAHRPYMSVEKLRAKLIEKRIIDKEISPEEFVAVASRKNTEILDVRKKKEVKEKMEERAIAISFVLALDEKMGWMDDI